MPTVTQPDLKPRRNICRQYDWNQLEHHPVTIVEMGFMTNESDDLKMSDPDFQDTMASGIADGIDAYFEEK